MSHHIGLQVLKAKVRGFQLAGQTIAARISRSEGDRKHDLWNEKRRLGTYARHHLIAYGLLRGVRYDRIETCAQDNKPNPQLVLDIMLTHESAALKKHLNIVNVKLLLMQLTPEDATAELVAASAPSSKATSALPQIQSPVPPPRSILGRLMALSRPLEKRA